LHTLEEVGEIAGELKRLWSKNYDPFDASRLAEEIVDVFCLLSALAHEFDIDLEQAVRKKFFEADGQRTWKTAARQGDAAGGAEIL
jgi:NTP pyrophosphatase (non-canonical NTP hydrolase)